MYQNSKSGVVLKMVIKSTSLTSDFLLEVEVCQFLLFVKIYNC